VLEVVRVRVEKLKYSGPVRLRGLGRTGSLERREKNLLIQKLFLKLH
jgi:hypothetical protein